MTYKAKVDWWIGGAIILGLVMPVVIAMSTQSYLYYAFAAATWILVFGFCLPQSYETTEHALVIRAGHSKRSISYAKIVAVRPSSDSRSALALSLDRIQIEHATGEMLIAPRDKEAFFADIALRATQIHRRGQELVITLE
jgi:hypothetical protein